MSHHVHVDLSGFLHDGRTDALVEDACPPRSPRRAEHQLGGVALPGEVQQCGGNVIADDRVQRRAEVGGQFPDLAHSGCRHPGEAVATDDVHDHQLGTGLRRDAKSSAHQRLRLGAAGYGDDHPLARLPGVGDPVVGAVLGQRCVDLVGEPQQRQFAQRGEVAAAEVVRQCGVDPLGGVDVAVVESAPQRLRGDVDELDLVGRAHHIVGHLLLLLDAGDLGDDVVEALQVLHVHRGDHGDAGVEQFLDVLPALGVAAARGVGVGEFVDEHDLGPPHEHGVDVEFREPAAAVLDVAGRNDLDAVEQFGGPPAAMGLDERGDQVGAAFQPPVRLAEHRERLADAGSCAQVDAQLTPLGVRRVHPTIIHPGTSRRVRR